MSTCATCRFVTILSEEHTFCRLLTERVNSGPVPKCIPKDWDFVRVVCYPDDPCEAWEPRA